MLVVPTIADALQRERIARQSALMIAAVQLHKQEIGLPITPPPIDSADVGLLAEARQELQAARDSNGHDVWGVVHHISHHEGVKRFLKS